MNNPLIFYAYTPDQRRWERRPSLEAIAALEDAGYGVHRVACRNPTDYARGLGDVWQHPGPLFIIEHDMAPSVKLIDAMAACPEPTCAGVYWIALATQGRRPMLSACRYPMGSIIGNVTNPRIELGEARAQYSGIGCCKLGPSARLTTLPPPADAPWSDVEYYVNRVAGTWHLHYPVVPHHHGFMTKEEAEIIYAQK